jgi:hypothetical protein
MTDVVDAYVSAVGRGLRGPRRMRADMLAEVRDALMDAAEGHRRSGAGEAEWLAVREFGPASGVAAGLQGVLAVAQARRTVWWLLAVLGGHFGVTWYIGHSGQWDRYWGGTAPGPGYLALAEATDVFVVVVLLAAVAAVAVLGWGLRVVGIRRPVLRWTAGLTTAAVAGALVAATLLTLLGPGAGSGLAWSGLVWTAPFGLVLGSAWRCWRSAGLLPATR